MAKTDKQAITFVIIFLIAAGFILGYFTAMNNFEPQTVEKEVIRVVEVEPEFEGR